MTDLGAAGYPHVPVPLALLLDEAISDAAKVLWSVLYQYAVTEGSLTFEMTTEALMELSSAAKGSVVKRRRELVAAGWLTEESLRGLGLRNLYTVRFPDGIEVSTSAD